jgi:glutathione S-transferase
MAPPSNLQPIKVHGRVGPNPPKVAMILSELNLPHEFSPISFADVKKPEFLAVNPNGRMPAIEDPNSNLTLWESGAILEYLVERYDTERTLSFAPGSSEAYLAKQWLFFQTTGQGPYYGQAVWFIRYHPERLQSAVDRYVGEIKRVSGVLETHLAKQKEEHGGKDGFDGPWLVGNKLSYVDFAFVPWQASLPTILPAGEYDYNEDEFPTVKEWLAKLGARESVKKAIAAMRP